MRKKCCNYISATQSLPSRCAIALIKPPISTWAARASTTVSPAQTRRRARAHSTQIHTLTTPLLRLLHTQREPRLSVSDVISAHVTRTFWSRGPLITSRIPRDAFLSDGYNKAHTCDGAHIVSERKQKSLYALSMLRNTSTEIWENNGFSPLEWICDWLISSWPVSACVYVTWLDNSTEVLVFLIIWTCVYLLIEEEKKPLIKGWVNCTIQTFPSNNCSVLREIIIHMDFFWQTI